MLECAFGTAFANGLPLPATQAQAVLLARLAVDPHSGFDDSRRKLAICRCCMWEVLEQKRLGRRLPYHDNEVARVLFHAESTESLSIGQILSAAVLEADLRELNLRGTDTFDCYVDHGLILGEQYAVSMHPTILRRIATHEEGYTYLQTWEADSCESLPNATCADWRI